MKKMKCTICGYIHDEAKDGAWDAVADGWVCPLCKAEKSAFVEDGVQVEEKQLDTSLLENQDRELSALEMSVVCSNLARGCEKQYLLEEAALFAQLADDLKGTAEVVTGEDMDSLLKLVNKDLLEIFPLVEGLAQEHGDRGVLRAYTWSVKTTMILKSLLERYAQLGDKMLENTGVYVCAVCGFIYVGNTLPEVCPVCKVPNMKLEEIGGGVHA